ncbi:MAG: ribokinase [Victivallaceae bacterium]|nr:ribokinase [Victivallaceae bacterium]
MKPRITVIGSLNMDFSIRVPRLPRKGESLPGKGFSMVPGGKGANQAVAAARLGAEVFLAGRIGNDLFGDQIVDNLVRSGVNTNYVVRDLAKSTGVGLVILNPEGDNYSLVDRGANMAGKAEDVAAIRDTASNSDMLLLQLEIPLNSIKKAVRIANAAGVPVILDPAPVYLPAKALFPQVDFLLPNQNEAEFYTGIKVTDRISAENAAARLVLLGAGNVIIKLGNQGALFHNQEKTVYFPGIEVETRDTIAAGDAFAGAFAVALVKGGDIISALEYANYVGALAVTRPGTQSSLPRQKEVEQFIKMKKRYVSTSKKGSSDGAKSQ